MPPSPEPQSSTLSHQRSHRPKTSLRISQPPLTSHLANNKRHSSDLSLSTIAEESNSYSSSSPSFCCVSKTPECSRRCQSTQVSNLNGASVIVEPHVTVETTTYVKSTIGDFLNALKDQFDIFYRMTMEVISAISNPPVIILWVK